MILNCPLHSYSLIAGANTVLAFAQYYLREGKCHLGRLVVNPAFRRQGLITELICRLCELGKAEFAVDTCSLFVFTYNTWALNAYQKLGFQVADYPEDIPLENCVYIIHGAVKRATSQPLISDNKNLKIKTTHPSVYGTDHVIILHSIAWFKAQLNHIA